MSRTGAFFSGGDASTREEGFTQNKQDRRKRKMIQEAGKQERHMRTNQFGQGSQTAIGIVPTTFHKREVADNHRKQFGIQFTQDVFGIAALPVIKSAMTFRSRLKSNSICHRARYRTLI